MRDGTFDNFDLNAIRAEGALNQTYGFRMTSGDDILINNVNANDFNFPVWDEFSEHLVVRDIAAREFHVGIVLKGSLNPFIEKTILSGGNVGIVTVGGRGGDYTSVDITDIAEPGEPVELPGIPAGALGWALYGADTDSDVCADLDVERCQNGAKFVDTKNTTISNSIFNAIGSSATKRSKSPDTVDEAFAIKFDGTTGATVTACTIRDVVATSTAIGIADINSSGTKIAWTNISRLTAAAGGVTIGVMNDQSTQSFYRSNLVEDTDIGFGYVNPAVVNPIWIRNKVFRVVGQAYPPIVINVLTSVIDLANNADYNFALI